MYEAAEIDGATRWHKIKCITLPLLKSTVITMTLLSIGRIFYSDFGLFYQVPMNSGALINATNTIDTYVYRGLIELGDISMSSAACVYQSLMGFALVMIANWLTKRYSSEIPRVLLVVASFTSNNEIVLHGYSFFPKELSLEAYRYIWNERAQVFHAYGITILVTAIGTTIGVMMTLLYAYVLAHEKFPGKTFLAFYLFFTMLFNGGLVPTYIMYTRYLHMKNTIPALIIPGLLMSAFNVILTRTYIQSNVPAALSEAPKIDGATEFQVFRKVVLPMCTTIIATVGLFAGLGYWNDWTNGLYYITDTNKFSIQQLLNNMIKNIEFLSKNANSNITLASVGGGIPQETVRMAIAIVGLLPILIVFPFGLQICLVYMRIVRRMVFTRDGNRKTDFASLRR